MSNNDVPSALKHVIGGVLITISSITVPLYAQKKAEASQALQATPKDMFEIGLHAGHFFISGDIPYRPGYGGGFHIRKSTDYLFSIKADFLYGIMQGEALAPEYSLNQSFDTQWYSGSVAGVMSLNALRWDKSVRTSNFFVSAGVGANYFSSAYFEWMPTETRPLTATEEFSFKLAPHFTLGAGFSLRLSSNANISLEHNAIGIVGRRSDLSDGYEGNKSVRTAYRDFIHYTGLRLNFNIGNPEKASEPLYWLNPLDFAVKELNKAKAKEEAGFYKDSDGDGVTDALDAEPNSPAGAMVDTKGRTLDSDGDGVPDHLDTEPYNTPRNMEKVDETGAIITFDRPSMNDGVTEEKVKELIDERLKMIEVNSTGEGFLPMIHFATDSYTIKYADYGNLAGVAKMLKANPGIKLVVTGYTDQTASEKHNLILSYNRAKATVEHLVNNLGINRNRLLIQYQGMQDALVPSASNLMNRRVEFRTARVQDKEMQAPAGYQEMKKGY